MTADQPANQPGLLRRPHTILGVCEAIGEDFGFSPLFLRIAFAAGLFFNTIGVIALYFALGGVVALSRWIAPVPTNIAPPSQQIASHNDAGEMKIAA